jgi:exosortase family protein XrtF
MIRKMLTDFRPALLFLSKFVGMYILANVLYALFITAYEPGCDPITYGVTDQTSFVLNVMGWDTEILRHILKPTTGVLLNNKEIISVYEGCNGINVAIVFLSFLFAFGPYTKTIAWFSLAGIVIIHISNLARIIILFFVALKFPRYLYITHKYFFTGIIYLIVFALWVLWIRKYALVNRKS